MNTTMTSTEALKTAEGRGSLVRPRFTPGLLLLDEDLTAGVDYTRELSRLLFRNLFGCGVICGLKVTGQEATGRCLTVAVDCGIALDCAGDPVQVQQPQSLTIVATCDKTLPAAVWVALRRREHDCMPRELACPPEAGGQNAVKTRTIDCYEIAVLDHRPDNACGCPERTPTTGTSGQQTPSTTGAVGAPANTPPSTAAGTHAAAGPAPAAGGTDCYADHRNGVCACNCCMGSEWLLLAKLTPPPSHTGGTGTGSTGTGSTGTGATGAGSTGTGATATGSSGTGAASTSGTGIGGTGAGQQPHTVAWTTDYSVRRFIRPQLLPDPLVPSG
jgi:hypothetical protein